MPVTVDELLPMVRAVVRSTVRPLVVADLPFGSYQGSPAQALETAVRFLKEGGAHGVGEARAGIVDEQEPAELVDLLAYRQAFAGFSALEQLEPPRSIESAENIGQLRERDRAPRRVEGDEAARGQRRGCIDGDLDQPQLELTAMTALLGGAQMLQGRRAVIEPRQRLADGAADQAEAVLDGEAAAVARAVDGATGHAGDGAALVGAYRGERLERAGPRLGDHDLLVGQDLAATDRDVGGQGQ